MFFFSSEQFEGIEVEDVLDRLASPLLDFSLFAQIGTKKDTIHQNVDSELQGVFFNWPPPLDWPPPKNASTGPPLNFLSVGITFTLPDT